MVLLLLLPPRIVSFEFAIYPGNLYLLVFLPVLALAVTAYGFLTQYFVFLGVVPSL